MNSGCVCEGSKKRNWCQRSLEERLVTRSVVSPQWCAVSEKPHTFKPRDFVRWFGGGPLMVVKSINDAPDPLVTCEWFGPDGQFRYHAFPARDLVPTPAHSAPVAKPARLGAIAPGAECDAAADTLPQKDATVLLANLPNQKLK
jgi:uncharacterized protein YodC (DUF2158 family)